MSDDVPAEGLRRGWAWVAHLRAGGTTAWRDFEGDAPSQGPWLPGAIQLELARQVNLAGGGDPTLLERVLAASAPGRGLPDLELIGVHNGSVFGPRPVDPAEVPINELVRMACGVIAEDLVGRPAGEPIRQPRSLRRSRFHVEGDPLLVHEALRDRRPPRQEGGRLLILGAPLEQMVYDAWCLRTLSGSTPSWGRWVRRFADVDRLPSGIDLAGRARRWVRQFPQGRVELDFRTRPRSLRPDAVEAARQVTMTLRVLVPGPELELLRERVIDPWVLRQRGDALAVPTRHAEWLTRSSGLMADRIAAAGYPVHGDPDVLTSLTASNAAPRPQRVLQTVVRLLREGWDQR